MQIGDKTFWPWVWDVFVLRLHCSSSSVAVAAEEEVLESQTWRLPLHFTYPCNSFVQSIVEVGNLWSDSSGLDCESSGPQSWPEENTR